MSHLAPLPPDEATAVLHNHVAWASAYMELGIFICAAGRRGVSAQLYAQYLGLNSLDASMGFLSLVLRVIRATGLLLRCVHVRAARIRAVRAARAVSSRLGVQTSSLLITIISESRHLTVQAVRDQLTVHYALGHSEEFA